MDNADRGDRLARVCPSSSIAGAIFTGPLSREVPTPSGLCVNDRERLGTAVWLGPRPQDCRVRLVLHAVDRAQPTLELEEIYDAPSGRGIAFDFHHAISAARAGCYISDGLASRATKPAWAGACWSARRDRDRRASADAEVGPGHQRGMLRRSGLRWKSGRPRSSETPSGPGLPTLKPSRHPAALG